jgi:hypothetical protein
MDVEYLSDDDTIYTDYMIETEVKANQYEPTFENNYYPPLGKHSSKQIISMIDSIDAINKKLNMTAKIKKHRFKERSRKIYAQYYPWVCI